MGSYELNCVVRVVLSSYANTARLQEASIARGVQARLATKSLPLAMSEEEFYALNLKIAALEVQREPLLEQRLRAVSTVLIANGSRAATGFSNSNNDDLVSVRLEGARFFGFADGKRTRFSANNSLEAEASME